MFFRNNQGMHNIVKYLYMCKCFIVLMVLWGYNVDAEETYVVRKVNWDMTPEQVRESETWKFLWDKEEGDKRSISYTGSLITYPCAVEYTFNNQKLTSVAFAFLRRDLPNTDEMFESSQELLKSCQELLMQKYGEPERLPPSVSPLAKDRQIWLTKDGKTCIVLSSRSGNDLGISVVYLNRQYNRQENNQSRAENPF
ncbi:MAG: hypothetical protein OXN20_13535 [Gemmatimonadota bacterium]|nr:hypothetical protein [Gemmatimonadota bacterium]